MHGSVSETSTFTEERYRGKVGMAIEYSSDYDRNINCGHMNKIVYRYS